MTDVCENITSNDRFRSNINEPLICACVKPLLQCMLRECLRALTSAHVYSWFFRLVPFCFSSGFVSVWHISVIHEQIPRDYDSSTPTIDNEASCCVCVCSYVSIRTYHITAQSVSIILKKKLAVNFIRFVHIEGKRYRFNSV